VFLLALLGAYWIPPPLPRPLAFDRSPSFTTLTRAHSHSLALTKHAPRLGQPRLIRAIEHEHDGVTLVIVLFPDRADGLLSAEVEEAECCRGEVDLTDCRGEGGNQYPFGGLKVFPVIGFAGLYTVRFKLVWLVSTSVDRSEG
jgi:hypothetical protein